MKIFAYVKHLGWKCQVVNICFSEETVEVDLTNGNGDTSEYTFDEVELSVEGTITLDKINEIKEYINLAIYTQHCTMNHMENTEFEKGKISGLINASNIVSKGFDSFI